MSSDHRKILASAAGGAVGGLLASAAMTYAYRLYQSGSEGKHPEREQNAGSEEQDRPDPTAVVADYANRTVTGHDLPEDAKSTGGQVVHYTFGTLVGLFYGAVAGQWPAATSCFGTVFGTAVWLGADEAALPALGLSGPPSDYEVSHHAYGLAAHLLYGAITEGVRRTVESALIEAA